MKLVEKPLGHVRIVMLPGVNEGLIQSKCRVVGHETSGHGRHFHKLRPSAHDRQNLPFGFHGPKLASIDHLGKDIAHRIVEPSLDLTDSGKPSSFGDMSTYTGTDNLEIMAEAKNYNRFLHEQVARDLREGSRVVDFGAGIGTFAFPLVDRGCDLIAIEADPGLRTILKEKKVTSVSDLTELPDGSVDYLYSLNVLEHIEDDHSVVQLWAQKLKPEGRLFLYVPAFDILFSSMDRKVGHFRRYTKTKLNPMIEAAGLTIIESTYVDSLGFLASLLYRFLDRGTGSIDRGSLILYDRMVFPFSRGLDRAAGAWFGKNLLLRAIKT